MARVCDGSFGKILVQTANYRAPEIFLEDPEILFESDLWAAGCVMAELALGMFLFSNYDEMEDRKTNVIILAHIRAFLGDSFGLWPNYAFYREEVENQAIHFDACQLHWQLFGVLGGAGYDLLMKLLTIDKKVRISAAKALRHPFFVQDQNAAGF